jgi:hypothetical protein
LGIGPNPQSPIPNPQSPIPNPQYIHKKRKIDLNKIYLLVGTPFILNKYYNISIIEK